LRHPAFAPQADTKIPRFARDDNVTTPPVDGLANEACVEFFAKFLKVPRSSVTIAFLDLFWPRSRGSKPLGMTNV